MEAIYYASGALMTIVTIALIVLTITFLARPNLINDQKIVKKPFTRPKILGIGVVAIVISLVGFGSVLAATDPNPQTSNEETKIVEEQPAEEEPVIEVKTEIEKKSVPFKTVEEETATLNKGETEVSVAGVDGEKTITYSVTYTDGVETKREKVSEEVTKEPIDKVILVGTYVYVAPEPEPEPASSCDPNYSGCVPIASDVDCAGGSGNGPAYVSGPVSVIGYDKYDLDRDGDGIACE